jgi:hypothetical protein
VIFRSESSDFCFAECDDFVCFGIDNFAEAVAFYRFIASVGESEVELAVRPHVGSGEQMFWQRARTYVLHTMLVEIDGSRSVFWVGRVSV